MVRWLLVVLGVSSLAQASETMRIAVGPETAAVTIDGEELTWAGDDEDAAYVALGRSHVTIGHDKAQLLADGEKLPVEAVRLRGGGSGAVKVNGARVRGDIVVLAGKQGLVAINVLPLEDYLVGVLGSEMPKSFPPEALKAQAIAARTYALGKKLEQYGKPFYLGSSVISQVYKGLDAEDPRTREAVEATRGQVLTFQLQPIEAYFHSSCGGKTESGLDALGRDLPYLQSVECPCHKLASSHWSMTVGASELSGAKTLEVDGRTATGRARKVQMGSKLMDAVRFRERIGYMKLKSLNFVVEKVKTGFRLTGHGFGHGAGLCQMGARLLAEQGWDAGRILDHYYPGAELQTLY